MTDDNKISATISPEDKQAILAAFQLIKNKLPFLVHLTPQESRRMPTIGTERGGMNQTYSMEMNAHPSLVPSFVDMEEVNKDSALWADLDELLSASREVCEGLEHTQRVVGSDLYMAYLSFYQNVRQAARRSVAGATSLLNNLKRYFQRGGGDGGAASPPAA